MRKLRIGLLTRCTSGYTPELDLLKHLRSQEWADVVSIRSGSSSHRFGPPVWAAMLSALKQALGLLKSRVPSQREEDFRSGQQEWMTKVGRGDSGETKPINPAIIDYDVILTYDSHETNKDWLHRAHFGVWKLHWGYVQDPQVEFWDLALRRPVIVVTVRRVGDRPHQDEVIARGYYNPRWNHRATRRYVFDHAPNLVAKHLKILHVEGTYKTVAEPCSERPYGPLSTLALMLYIGRPLIAVVGKTLRRVLPSLGFRPWMWSLFVGEGRLSGSELWQLREIAPNRGEFWADPFLVRRSERTYLFFENYSYKTRVAKISFGVLEQNRFISVGDALVRPYHLSYPFVFEHDGETFMLPETSANERLEVWRATRFPDRWELYSTAFDGQSVHDPTLFVDDDGTMWLFLNRGAGSSPDGNSELWIYKVDGPQLKLVIPHKLNPVIIDSRRARNAGAIYRENGEVIRPSQNNSYGVYGYGLNLGVISRLTSDEYVEETKHRIFPRYKKGLVATHHLSQLDDVFVVDGCFRLRR